MEVDKDHLHLMVTSVPKVSPLQIVRKLKQETTVRKTIEEQG
jgi:putative transposase